MNYKQFIYIVVVLGMNFCLFGATVITSDAQNTTQSFDFPISQFAYSTQLGGIFTGALSGTSNTFSIAFAARNSNTFLGLTPETIMLNNVQNQANPLFNKSILRMTLIGGPALTFATMTGGIMPIVATTDAPGVLYALHPSSLLSSAVLNDAQGSPTAGIAAIAGNFPPAAPVGSAQPSDDMVVALVTPCGSGGTYGATGSGVSVGVVQAVPETTPTEYAIDLFDATTGLSGNKAFPLDRSTTGIYITSALASLTTPVLYFDGITRLFFAGFQATASAGVGDGALGVMRVFGASKIELGAIAPAAAIEADSIIGTSTPSGTVTIYDLKTMLTSTNVEYLIVSGGTTSANRQRSIFAVPLVTQAGANLGVLADINTVPETQFNPNAPYLFLGRGFVTPAATAGDLYTSASVPALVGGGVVAGDVSAMMVKNDTVIVAASGSAGKGVYVSQALFDTYGRIAQWTPWARVAGTVDNVFGVAVDNDTGSFIYSTGESSSLVNTVERTVWGNTGIISAALAPVFTKDTAGIQGFFDFGNVAITYGGCGTEASCCIATGYNQVSLVQTGTLVSGQLVPLSSIASSFSQTDGTLTGFAPGVNQVSVSGGDLASIGAIISACFVQNGAQAWLFVGGTGGIAVLADDDGSGFNSTSGIGYGFRNLRSTMKFRKVGNYTNVRKLLATRRTGSRANGGTVQDLYVLSPSSLAWATITQARLVVGGTWDSGELASASSLVGTYGSLSDVAISNPLALLATSKGLYRSGNGADISLAETASDVVWTAVTVPETPGPITRLLPFSPTIYTNDFGSGGNVYVLAGAVSTSQARLYRYVVTVTGGVVDNTTVQLFPDCFRAQTADATTGIPSFLMNLGNYRNYFSMSGGSFYFSRSAYLDALPLVTAILEPVRSATLGLGGKQGVALSMPTYRAMGQLVSNVADGSLCAYGDFGLQVNE